MSLAGFDMPGDFLHCGRSAFSVGRKGMLVHLNHFDDTVIRLCCYKTFKAASFSQPVNRI